MQIISTTVVVLVAISAGFSHAQDELIGLEGPYEYEGNDIDIWEEEYRTPNDLSIAAKDTLLSICNLYDLTVNGESIDCSNIKLSKKSSESVKHTLRKREADDTLVEGSGEGELQEVEKAAQESHTEAPVQEPASNDHEEPKESNVPESLFGGKTQEENQANSTNNKDVNVVSAEESIANIENQQVNNEEKAPKEDKLEEPIKDQEPSQASAASEHVETKKEVTEEEVVKKEQLKEEKVPIVKETKIEEDEGASPIQVKSPAVAAELGEHSATNVPTLVPEKTDSASEAQPPAALPSDLEETRSGIANGKEQSNAEEKTETPKVTEKVDEQQSANAELNSSVQKEHNKEEHVVEGSEGDKAVMKMATSADTKAIANPQPDAGESAKDIQKAGKDTTVLIVLFTIVIAVGVLAFAYNYVRKQKKRREANIPVAYDANVTKRSAQNLTNNGKTDVEQGTELKPLIKNADQKAATDYSDKGNGKIEEINEK